MNKDISVFSSIISHTHEIYTREGNFEIYFRRYGATHKIKPIKKDWLAHICLN